MKTKLIALLAACAVGLSVASYTVLAQTEPTPTPPTTPGAPGTGQHHRHPAILQAIRALERAKAELQAASHDFGGHRADAVTACDAAISQLKLALQYANAGSNQQAPAQP